MLATQFDHGGHAADVALGEAALRELIARDRAELRARARRIGRRLYAECPNAHERRLVAYPRSARSHERSGQPARSARGSSAGPRLQRE